MLFRTQVTLTGRKCVAKAEDQSQKELEEVETEAGRRVCLQSVLVVTRRGSYGKLLLVTTPDRDGNAIGGEDVDTVE
ncbi:hypothetical protein T11_4113 [Trichinella zimbabwensis]|uniref:Uncharacterized protein n=1 Tax=Trichinella zimbabwensis TaxID=268475 RepID=A0A0V1H6P9_9BILA|nr:hypothetical protein T11_4113 [Trichinella zimbabwensis]